MVQDDADKSKDRRLAFQALIAHIGTLEPGQMLEDLAAGVAGVAGTMSIMANAAKSFPDMPLEHLVKHVRQASLELADICLEYLRVHAEHQARGGN